MPRPQYFLAGGRLFSTKFDNVVICDRVIDIRTKRVEQEKQFMVWYGKRAHIIPFKGDHVEICDQENVCWNVKTMKEFMNAVSTINGKYH